jgi:2-keto-4-pentenoate hydratase/2-oxohepta-3-ene-1,7-dioic acid hydratase in catechol pathway
MRFATYRDHDDARPAAVGVVRLESVHLVPGVATMRELIDLGLPAALDLGRAAVDSSPPVPLTSVTLLAPLEPASVRDFVAFEEHVEGVRRSVDGATGVPAAWYDAPTFYFTNPHTILGPDEPARFPAASVARDFELEVAVVVGRSGTSLSPAEAVDHVFGFTLMNDWSARDLQGAEMKVGLGPAKGKDFATSLGPWIVTVDELAEHLDEDGFLDVEATVRVNGEVVGRDRVSHMGWGFWTLVAYASRDSRVVPGDVLGSGTTGGGGCLAELWGRRGTQDPPPLRDGDEVELAVDGIGLLRSTVASRVPAPALPPVRRPQRVI